MNCDDVFEALTDPGRFPTAELDGHLATCPRCRQLQQVLEPARSLLSGELPAENVPAPAEGWPYEFAQGARPTPLLSAESVGLAETIAAQLAAASESQSVRPHQPFGQRRLVVAALRSAALVLFGALAVYCVGPRNDDSDSHANPAVVPPSRAVNACTRIDLQRKGQPSQDAHRVILSCVACHMHDAQPERRPASTSLFWPPRKASVPVSLALLDADEIATAKPEIRITKAARMS